MENYSVLMSVYAKEKAAYLKTAMNSMFCQTIPTDDFVLVCDGELNNELNAVVDEMEQKYKNILHIVRLERNRGLGNALNIGNQHCKNELVARMDSDDISMSNRCEKQLAVFREHQDVAIVSGIVEEFSRSTDQIKARRVPPETQEQILKFAKKRNPFNHPCVMYKKSAVEASGEYQTLYLLEDYFLWIRMLQKGFVGYNLQEPLLWMRTSSEMYKRRAGWKYAKSQERLFHYMRKSGFIGYRDYIKSVLFRGVISIIPNWLRKFIFKTLLRTK